MSDDLLPDLIENNDEIPPDPKFNLRDLEDAIIYMISINPFYANLLMQTDLSIWDLKRNKKLRNGAGASVRITKTGRLDIRINPYFFDTLGYKDQALILMHELAHVILGHMTSNRFIDTRQKKVLNVARDLGIHEILTDVKKSERLGNISQTVEGVNKALKKMASEGRLLMQPDESVPQLKNNDTSENYFTTLMKYIPEGEDDEFFGEDDGHDFGEEDTDAAKAAVAQALQKAIANTKNNAGKVPMDAEITLSETMKNKVRWQSVMRRFLGTNIGIDKKTSVNRRNRRNDDITVPGNRKRGNPVIASIVDTSGSMTKEELAQIVAEFVKLEKEGYDIYVIEADTDVKRYYKFIGRKFTGFLGGGGTAYQPAITKAMSYRPDVIMYFGDMDSYDTPADPGVPFLWITTKKQEPPGKFGKVLDISG